MNVLGNGECSGDAVGKLTAHTDTTCSESIFKDQPSFYNGYSYASNDDLHFLQATTHPPRPIKANIRRNRHLCLWFIPQIFAYAANFPIQKFLQSQSIVAPSSESCESILIFHLLLSWIVIFKLGYGLLGGALVLSLSWWLLVIAQFVTGLWSFFRLSAASAIMLCLEIWYYQILVLISGLLENAEVALDSLSICMTISRWVYMISVRFNAAASVRLCVLGNLCPETLEEAIAMVPSIKARAFTR